MFGWIWNIFIHGYSGSPHSFFLQRKWSINANMCLLKYKYKTHLQLTTTLYIARVDDPGTLSTLHFVMINYGSTQIESQCWPVKGVKKVMWNTSVLNNILLQNILQTPLRLITVSHDSTQLLVIFMILLELLLLFILCC